MTISFRAHCVCATTLGNKTMCCLIVAISLNVVVVPSKIFDDECQHLSWISSLKACCGGFLPDAQRSASHCSLLCPPTASLKTGRGGGMLAVYFAMWCKNNQVLAFVDEPLMSTFEKILEMRYFHVAVKEDIVFQKMLRVC